MAVVKLQDVNAASLTTDEKNYDRHFLSAKQSGSIGDDVVVPQTMKEAFEKRRKTQKHDSGYIDFECIPGLIAEVESMLSIAKYILAAHRRAMTPQLFEVLFS